MANGKPASRTKSETFVWTDDEVELLLQVTLDYKSDKLQENVDWESCQSKYGDITDAFLAQYPTSSAERDFPHEAGGVSKSQVTAKLKNIRGKYRQAVKSGRWNGHGRVVLIFSELCEQIWGESSATRSVDAGIETGDLGESSPRSSVQSASPTTELAAGSPNSSDSVESLPPAGVKQRRGLHQLDNRGGDRLKRKHPVLADPAVREDLQIKRRMLQLMEEATRHNADHMQQINANIACLTNMIQDSFSLMRELLLQSHNAQPHSSSGRCGQVQGPPVLVPGTQEIKGEVKGQST